MEEILKFETIARDNAYHNYEALHPLVTVIDYSEAAPRKLKKTYFGFYMILLKDVKCGDLKYGKSIYDNQEGTLVFIAPAEGSVSTHLRNGTSRKDT